MNRGPVNRGERDWEAFWGNVWYNLLHSLGVIAVLGIAGGIIWSFLAPSPPRPVVANPHTTIENSSNREPSQLNFSRDLLAGNKPCGTKSKKISDVSSCSLFGLQLGMGHHAVKHIIDSSGYFPRPSQMMPNCADKNEPNCASEYIYQGKDGFSLTVTFALRSPDEGLQANSIQMIFGPGGNPYFEPDGMRQIFAKIFGPPDGPSDGHHTWGGSEKGAAKITAYSYKGQYWVRLEHVK